jgi:hypothetical protein
MDYGISNDPLSAPGGVDVSHIHREVEHAPDQEPSPRLDERVAREKVAFEWVSPSVRTRRDGVIGIEFDGRGMVVIGLDGDSRKEHVIDHVLVTRYEDSPDAQFLADRLRTFVHHRQADIHVVLSTPRAVVRRFLLPPVPARQRATAALWEGQKLIPFSLKDGEALYGLDYATAGERGWWVTLVAVPTEDAAPMLDAIAGCKWMLRTVSLIGAQRFNEEVLASGDEATATVTWSARRGCFSVYHRGQMVFHYDLGPMPAMPAKMDLGVVPESMAVWQRWTDSLGAAVSDSLDFHLNVNPILAPSRLRLYGLPQAAAPLLTDWQNRFPGGVIVGDPLAGCDNQLPEGVSSWLSSNPGLVAPTLAALTGTVAIDLTPARIRQERDQVRWERIARGLCTMSVAACVVWAGLLWAHIVGHKSEVGRSREALAQYQESPVNIKLDQAIVAAANSRLLLTAASQSGQTWMPWLKTVLRTLPENAHLLHIDIEQRTDLGGVIAHLEGTLGPGSLAHAMSYREWFDRLRPLCAASPILVSERDIEVASLKRSAFTIELMAPKAMAATRGVGP